MGGKGSKVTVGYRYSQDVQAGLGRGPVNEIVSIMADKRRSLPVPGADFIQHLGVYRQTRPVRR